MVTRSDRNSAVSFGGRATRLSCLGVLAFALLLPVLTGNAAAQALITYQSVSGNWHDPTDNVPGSQPGEPVITNGVPTSSINWGVTNGSQSGYDFTATIPPPQQLPGPAPFFSLGTFTHRNFVVSDPSLTSVQLDIVLLLDVDGVTTGPLAFTFLFNHEETPNTPPPGEECPYPTPLGEGCTDRVTFVSSPQPTTFNVGGVDYTLSMSFLENGVPVSEFITREGGIINTAGLIGQFTVAPIPPDTPALTLTKSGPATMNVGQTGDFSLDVQNTGTGDAWNALIRDVLPDGATGGMCDLAPQILGVTLAGSPLTQGTHYALGYTGPPSCELTLTLLDAAGAIAPGEHLIVSYRTQLDADTQNGATLTNVAGATEWFDDDSSNASRTGFTRTLTNGTPGVLDHEDAFTVTGQINVPVLFASKSVALVSDAGTPNVVDPGDVLRYTISVQNSGGVPATGVTLTDAVPANTGYEAGSTTLNGSAVPDGVGFPLAAGLPISSSDLTPPLPGSGAGTLSAGGSAVITFELRVDAGVPGGTVISNQGVVGSSESPNLPTDGDGNPATGPEPTVVIVGAGQQLTITKQVAVVGGGPALPGATLEYTVTVQNIALVPAFGVVITDDLGSPIPGQLAYVNLSATLNGSATGVTVTGTLITADYFGTFGPLAPLQSIVLRFRATVAAGLAAGTTLTNTGIVTWNTPPETASASVSIDVGAMPGSGVLNGTVWHDADFDDALGAGERTLEGWIVELYQNGTLLQSAITDSAGVWSLSGVAPNTGGGVAYEVRFRAPDAGANSAKLGRAASAYTNGLQVISDIVVPPGTILQNLDLPIDPNGVVYHSLQRTPVPGAMLTLLNSAGGAPLPSLCFDDPVQQGQVTRSDGYYKFDLNFSDPLACPTGGSYLIAVTPPGASFAPDVSLVIPPTSGASTAPLSVPTCPGSTSDALPGTVQFCEATASEFAPGPAVPPRTAGTIYHLHVLFDDSLTPGSSQIFNNHIPLDPVLEGAVGLVKTTPSLYVSHGQLVPYEILFTTEPGSVIPDLSIVDRFPAGFTYVKGSAQIDGVQVEPTIVGRELRWLDLGTPSERRRLVLLLAVGSGVTDGEFVNRAQAFSSVTGEPLSGEAKATVRVVADPTFSCTDVLGKVFDDANRNGIQDDGERGLPGVRLATARGLIATTDPHGRFHITCAVVPRPDRGSNFVLKLDDRTLPSGYRMSTRPVQVQRATLGKALNFHFGASIQRVVGLDLADPVFDPGTTQMRPQWKPRIDLLLDELAKGPAILRLAYVADVEDESLVDRRVRAVKKQIAEAWRARDSYQLTIETEVFWRRGAPPAGSASPLLGIRSWESLLPSVDAGPPALEAEPESPLPSVDAGPPILEAKPGASAEKHMSTEPPFDRWSQDPAQLDTQGGDRIEKREVRGRKAKTVKLRNVVPPIRFDSGVAMIPPSHIAKLRGILDEMKHLPNVRLHLVGHADNEPLSPGLSRVFGDNEGLSAERAGEVAEYLKTALGLPPEAISFEWAGDTQPIASNATSEGRAQNRRVAVEVWYDEYEEKIGIEEVVVPQEIKRVKICRTETVCRLRYLEGHERRARVKNLIAPLHYGDEAAEVPEEFVRQVAETISHLGDKQHVTVKFIGYTDGTPLSGRTERIYGTHLALSKARAHRVALAVKDALGLPTAGVASDGFGAARPIASNETERGRASNRRIEVEFWYDDPLQELPDEPQPCPEAGNEMVTRVYEPRSGPLPSLQIVDGEPSVPPGYTEAVRRAMSEVADKEHVRLRFVGYTKNERLDRRTARVYGDDVGLSVARARRTMEKLKAEMGLSADQAEHEGRGFVQSEDVVNAGFLTGESSHVAVQVVYDEPAVGDDLEGIEATRITRELTPKQPLALNLMHITVDGEPIDDPGRSVADLQRCTDVALEKADIQFRFDDLESDPRLSVASQPIAAPVAAESGTAPAVRFRMYTNYPYFIDRSEVRIFEQEQALTAEPLAVVPVGVDGLAEWQPVAEWFQGPARDLKFVLRSYDTEGRYDETSPQSLWLVYGKPAPEEKHALLAGYGEDAPSARNIPLGSHGAVRVHGRGIPPEHSVWLAGAEVPVDEQGSFVGEVILPSGAHTVEVAVLDPEGNGELFLRDLEFPNQDWFFVGISDLTMAATLSGGVPDELVGKNSTYGNDSWLDGRLAFYLNGKFGEGWTLTASADTREGSVSDAFSNFLDKSPEALFRRIDPDYSYPTFGDDGTVEETAPTQGKFFAKLSKEDSHVMWGNFKVGYLDNELAQVDRGLYGGNLHYQSPSTTRFGERKLVLDGFAAEPGTVPSREELRGTGGSLYYLQRQDLLTGSERVRIETRDKDSGLVNGVVNLRPTLDYDIDNLQGRILLTEPLPAVVADGSVIRNEGLSGDEAWLVVQYEYTPGFDDIDAVSAGGQGRYWLNEHVGVGLLASHDKAEGDDTTLYAGDVTLRLSTDSWLKVQGGRSEGAVSTPSFSEDGGFSFLGTGALPATDANANAYRADVVVGIADFIEGARGRLNVYGQRLEGGYSAPGVFALTDTDNVGGAIEVPVTDKLAVTSKADWRIQEQGLETRAAEVDLGYQLTEQWSVGTGVRNEHREDDSAIVPLTQQEGSRTDAGVQIGYDSKGKWRGYGFGQMTLAKTGNREDNGRGGVGGAYRINDRLLFEGEVSHGQLGPAIRLGTNFQESEQTRRYLSYAFENERAYSGLEARTGKLISGIKTRLSDSSSVFLEDRFQHGQAATGLVRAVGITLAPSERWSFSANWEHGELVNSLTDALTKRKAGGGRIGYAYDQLQLISGVEYRFDETEQLDESWTDRTTWLFRNTMRLQMTPDARLVTKFNHSFSDSSLGQFYDGGYTEAVVGLAYRPVNHDRLNALFKYTYLYDFPTADQLGQDNTPTQFPQKSHVASLDVTYDLTKSFSIGGKYAYRLGKVSLDRDDPSFFDSNAHLLLLRGDWRFTRNWEGSLEGRMLALPNQNDRRAGALFTIYRYLGDHFKIGVGYNFTDFSDDLTDLSYDDHGLFLNLVGTM